MAYRTILLHLDHDRRNTVRLELALKYARDSGAHLVGLHVLPIPVIPYGYGEAAVTVRPDIIEQQRALAAERAGGLQTAFDAACRREGIAGEWRTEEGDAADVVSRHGRYADLVVLGQPDREEIETGQSDQLPHHVPLNSGTPVLVIPYAGDFPEFGRRPLVAWNGSREAARAMRDALPLLLAADGAIVLEIDPADGGPGLRAVEAAKLLARHGIKADAEYTVSGGTGVGDVLLSRLADFGCDSLVMGAYGHSRFREMILGGATRTVLDHMTVPVLLSH
jgi:nucleotide-binding universal stress UspA family protein